MIEENSRVPNRPVPIEVVSYRGEIFGPFQSAREAAAQLYVVDVEDRKSGNVAAVYVFDNHAAALKCRRDLKMSSDHLRGCVIFSDWREGQPHRAQKPGGIDQPQDEERTGLGWDLQIAGCR